MIKKALFVAVLTVVFVAQAMAAPQMTKLDPKVHGFKFSNTFHNDFIPALDVRTSGLCGGMSYAVLDFYNLRLPIPSQDYRPANRTVLQGFLYNRQVDSIVSNLDKWAELGFNPGGARNGEFFRWGLDGRGRIAELRAFIDLGIPVVLGLQGAAGRSGSHQVIAIGYDMGRYKGDMGAYQSDFKIFILDPNHPTETKTLIPDFSVQLWRLADDRTSGWHSYFVDKNYKRKPVPPIVNPIYAKDGKAHELLLTFETGGDDLRGGNDNVDVFVNMHDGTQQIFRNVNLGGRWLSNYKETVRLLLTTPVAPAMIKQLTVYTTFGGGISGDNWDMKSVEVRAFGGDVDTTLCKGGPHRFTGSDKQLAVPTGSHAPTMPAGSVDRLEMVFKTGGDDLRGGNDNVSVKVTFKDGVTQLFENVNHSSRWADNTTSTVTLNLNRAVLPELLMTVTISTSFGGGISGDNWNMNSVQVRAMGPGTSKSVASYGYKRFTGSDKVLVLPCTVTASNAGAGSNTSSNSGSNAGSNPGPTNLAMNHPAQQSSRSQWSTTTDPQGAVNGVKNGRFGFHTNKEANPWWQVDLGSNASLDEVKIFNRQDYNPERSKTIRVLLSTDGKTWRTVYSHNGSIFGGYTDNRPLRVPLTGQKARYLRLQLAENTYFHLDEVEVYGRPGL